MKLALKIVISYLTKDLEAASNVVKGKTYTITGSVYELTSAIDTDDSKIACKLVIQGDSLR